MLEIHSTDLGCGIYTTAESGARIIKKSKTLTKEENDDSYKVELTTAIKHDLGASINYEHEVGNDYGSSELVPTCISRSSINWLRYQEPRRVRRITLDQDNRTGIESPRVRGKNSILGTAHNVLKKCCPAHISQT